MDSLEPTSLGFRRITSHRRVLVMMLLVALGILTSALLWRFSAIKRPSQSGTATTKSISPSPIIQRQIATEATDCQNKKQHYQELVQPESTVSGIIVGSLKGIAKQAVYNPKTTSASFQLMSLRGGPIYDFTIRDQDVTIVNNIVGSFEETLSTIAVGQLITLSYNCDPKHGNTMTFVSISLANQ